MKEIIVPVIGEGGAFTGDGLGVAPHWVPDVAASLYSVVG